MQAQRTSYRLQNSESLPTAGVDEYCCGEFHNGINDVHVRCKATGLYLSTCRVENKFLLEKPQHACAHTTFARTLTLPDPAFSLHEGHEMLT